MTELTRRWALDASNNRFAVGDLVITTKRCWFGPGIRGEVAMITEDVVVIATDAVFMERITVRHFHVLIVRRRTGLAVWLRRQRQKVNERTNR